MDKISVTGSGLNGSTKLSIFSERGSVITGKKMEVLAKEIARRYPDIAEQVRDYINDKRADLPKNFDISKIEPGVRSNLLEAIAIQYGSEKSK